MNHVIWSLNTCDSTDRAAAAESKDHLGGMFYDYLRNSGGEVVGVLYNLYEEVDFYRHPAYKHFVGDPRFVFDKFSVTIVFQAHDAGLFRANALTLDVTQDFGGEFVIVAGERVGIEFFLGFVSGA